MFVIRCNVKRRNECVKDSCQKEERLSKRQLKINKKKKKKFVDLEKHLACSTRSFQKESTKYYSVLDMYSKLNMSNEQLHARLLPLTLEHVDLVKNNYPLGRPDCFHWPKLLPPERTDRICIRCRENFQINENDEYSSPTKRCSYHTKKPRGKPRRFMCCEQGLESAGCQFSDYHVTETMIHRRPLVKTRAKTHIREDEHFGVYGLDCEMSYTTNGLEVTKVCVVGADGLPVYNTFVKPEHPILDYNTFYSGVTANDFKDLSVTLADVQAYLLKLFNENTIVVGHSLNCDFMALGLIHLKVVDTSVIYRKKDNPDQKPSLKELAQDYLQSTIHDGTTGHDSVVDARTALELAFKKAEQLHIAIERNIEVLREESQKRLREREENKENETPMTMQPFALPENFINPLSFQTFRPGYVLY